MTRTMLSGLAAFAVVAMLASVPADAQQLKQRSGVHLDRAGSITAVTASRARSMPQRSQRLRSGQRQPSATTGAVIHAVAVYLQWRQQCLDNPFPDC